MSSSSPLDYAPPPPLHQRAVFFRWIWLTIALAIAVSARWWEPPAWRHIELLYWQHRCMVYTAPSDRVVFDSTQSIHFVPREWSSFYAIFSPPGLFSQATLFMHRMKKPNGQKRLVVVDYTPWLFGGTVQLSRVFVPGNAFQRPREFTRRSNLPIGNTTDIGKIFAGQIDPTDLSHFFFRAIQGDKEMIYDGWLQNDESVVIGLRRPALSTR